MYWNEPEWLYEYDIVMAVSRERLLEQLNRDAQRAASTKRGRWEAISVATDKNGKYYALRRREVWGCPTNATVSVKSENGND